VEREFIVAEIKRITAEQGGLSIGKRRFTRLTGIRESDWSGRYWARWSDALAEAGLLANSLQSALDDLQVLRSLLEAIESLGKWPTYAELKLYGRTHSGFPSHNSFRRLGSRADQAKSLLSHGDELSISERAKAISEEVAATPSDLTPEVVSTKGYVYLIRSGRFHKIGHANDVGRRAYELRLQLPEKASIVHQIETDDPTGIEAYWHRRFADRRANGEWFRLSAADLAAFRSRKSM
jgi:hypothetical protein